MALLRSRRARGWPRRVDVVLRDRFAGPDDALLRVLFERAVFGALGAQRVGDRVVAFEALVREELVARWRYERQRNRERRGVGFRIADLDVVAQLVRADAGDAL